MKADWWLMPQLGLARPEDGAGTDGPLVGPSLRVAYSPAMHRVPEGFAPVPESWEGDQLVIEEEPPAEPAWACPPSESGHSQELPGRNGFRGLPPAGRRAVRESATVMERERECLSFWTISLPDDALAALSALDGWAKFVASIRKLLVRRMASAGLPRHVIGVAELHPDRSTRMGCPLPHLHMVYRSRRHRKRPWLLTPAQHDELIAQALAQQGIYPRTLKAASEVAPIRKSVARYLAKYMAKGGTTADIPADLAARVSEWVSAETRAQVCLATGFPSIRWGCVALVGHALRSLASLVPRQWWFRSEELKSLVDRFTFRVEADFCRWLVEHAPDSPWSDQVSIFYVDPSESGAPPIWCLGWDSCGSLAHLLALWQQDCDDRKELLTHGVENGCLYDRF